MTFKWGNQALTGKWTHIFTYNNGWSYKMISNGEESGDLEAMEQGSGYWMKMNASCILHKM